MELINAFPALEFENQGKKISADSGQKFFLKKVKRKLASIKKRRTFASAIETYMSKLQRFHSSTG